MNGKHALSVVIVGLFSLCAPIDPAGSQSQQPTVAIPQPGVPQLMTMEGKFVRAAYNNEGYVILGYQLANRSLGEEWMLLEFGVTVRDNVPDYDFTRAALSLETPDGKTLPLPSVSEYRAAGTVIQALQNRSKAQSDSINYFPPNAHRACALTFFTDITSRVLPLDEMDLSSDRACVGRLYFHVPGGIMYGQHWLNVKFAQSVVRVPFRILTDEEERLLSKNFKSIKQQVKDAFRPKS